MPAEELLEIRKMISGFFEEMNQRAHQEDVKSKEGQSKLFCSHLNLPADSRRYVARKLRGWQ
jgi:hypothetical protein